MKIFIPNLATKNRGNNTNDDDNNQETLNGCFRFLLSGTKSRWGHSMERFDSLVVADL